MSTTLGAVAGSSGQAVAHTPNWNGCGVGAKPRAWSGLNPSWPCSATVNTQPAPGRPSDEAVTLFDSTGLAIQDLALCRALVEDGSPAGRVRL